MSDWWDSVASTVKSVGGAATAPFGFAVDVATMPFDGEDDDFGTLLDTSAKRVNQMFDPLFNSETLSGKTIGRAFEAMEWAYREGVSEPIVTGQTMLGHVATTGQVGDIGDPTKWAAAYEVAQDRSIGQAKLLTEQGILGALLGQGELDPLDKRAWRQVHEEAPFFTSMVSGTSDFVARWYLDPANVAGKGAKAYRQANVLRRVTKADDKAGIGAQLDRDITRTIGVGPLQFKTHEGLATRTSAWLDWADGKNAEQIRLGTPELDRSPAGIQIAGLIADAGKISDPLTKREAQKRILRVSYGDVDEIMATRSQLEDVASIEDGLRNVAKGNTLDMQASALGRFVHDRPEHLSNLEQQLANQPEVLEAVTKHRESIQALLDTASTARQATAGVTGAGKRRLARAEGTTAPRVLQSNLERLTKPGSAEGVFQKSLVHVPVRVVKKLYLDTPIGVMDALKTSKLQGIVNLHDVAGTSNQLNSMMTRARLTPAEKFALQSEFATARSEADRMRVIARAEKASFSGLARHYSDKYGEPIDQDFIEDLMEKGAGNRTSMLASLHGRAYAATRIEHAAGQLGTDRPNWRVDMIDDDGIPVAMPLLETQGANLVPLVDFDLADKMLRRNFSTLARVSRAWKSEVTELDRLSRTKASGGHVLDSALQSTRAAVDHLSDFTGEMLRIWKFGVLFRLGYPLRIIADDHMRIMSKIGAAAIYGPLFSEGVKNFGYNAVTRRANAHSAVMGIRRRIAEVDDALGDDVMQARNRETLAEVRKLNRAIAKNTKAGDATRADELTTRRDTLLEMVGPDVDALTKERNSLAALLEDRKALLGEKRRIGGGDRKIEIAGGYTVDDAFAGPYGESLRKRVSSNDTMEMELLDAEAGSYRNFTTSGSWRTIVPTERGHLDAWSWALNKHFRMSQPAMHFVRGGTLDEFVAWAKTPEGRAIAKRMPWHAADVEGWGARIRAMVDDYLPTQEARDALVAGEVTPTRLRKMFGNIEERPDVHGGMVDVNLGSGTTSYKINQTMSRLYKLISEKPTDALSRHPFFAAMYRQQVKEIGARHVAMAGKAGRGLGQRDLDEIAHQARKIAEHELKRTLFDISAHSNAAYLMRFVSPFFAAHQEGLQRWWRIVSDDPSVLRRFQQFFDAPRQLGLVVDGEGEPVKPGVMVSSEHRVLLQVPRDWLKAQDQDKYQSNWTLGHNSFNLVLQGGLLNPGVGPNVTVPVDFLTAKLADKKELEKLATTLNPYRPDEWYDSAVPATVQRVMAAIQGDDSQEYASAYARNAMDRMVAFQEVHERPPNRDETDRIMAEAEKQTRRQAWMRVGQNFLSPAPAAPQSRFEVIRQGWFRLQDQARAEGRPREWAEAKFEERYGEAFAMLTESLSNNLANLDRTQETVAFIKQHRSLLDQLDPSVQRMAISGMGEGAYSDAASRFLRGENVRPGDDRTYLSSDSPREAMVEGLASQGWSDYSKGMAWLTATAQELGLGSYTESSELVGVKQQMVKQLAERNWAWWDDYNSFDPSEYERKFADMKNLASYKPFLNDTVRGDVVTLQNYVALREGVQGELFARELAGGSASPDAQSNADLMALFATQVGQLVESNTWFEEFMYNGTIERDPFLTAAPTMMAVA